jgi:hypothetical protein
MRSIPVLALAMALGLPTSLAAESARATPSDVSAVRSIHGKIVGVNEPARLVTVRDDFGSVITVEWTDSTRLSGDRIKVGDTVWLDMTEQNGRAIATSITIQAARPY